MDTILDNFTQGPARAFFEELELGSNEHVIDNQVEVGRSFYLLAKLYYDKSDLSLAKNNFDKALELLSPPRDSFLILKTLGFLIRISSEMQNTQDAGRYIQLAESVLDGLAKTLGSLNAEYFYHLGTVKNYQGKFDEAEVNFSLAERKSKEENEPELLSKCLLAQSMNYFYRKNFDAAISYLTQLNQLLRIIERSYLLGSMYMFSGKVYLAIGQYERALESFKMANISLRNKKCWNLQGYILMWKGNVYKKMEDFTKAMTHYQMAIELIDGAVFKRLSSLLNMEVQEVTDTDVDIFMDRTNRKIIERSLGVIDFKHRFVLLEILFLLAQNPGKYYDKEYLAKSIWRDEYNPLIHDKLIYTSVSRLRKLIEPEGCKGGKSKYLIRGKDGYAFNPDAKIRFCIEKRERLASTPIANVELGSPV